LASLLEVVVHEVRGINPTIHSVTLHGDVALGEYAPEFSDIRLAVFTREALVPEDTAASLGLWSRLVRNFGDLGRRVVLTILPLPGRGPAEPMIPLGFSIRSRWDDGRAHCRAFWRPPFTELDLVGLVDFGAPLLGYAPRRFLHSPSLQNALLVDGRKVIEDLFLSRRRRRLLLRMFRRAARAGLPSEMQRIDARRYVTTVLRLTRLLQGLRDHRLAPHSASGFWFAETHPGPAGRFAREIAAYRLDPGRYPEGFLTTRAHDFPLLARVVLEEAAPSLYNRALQVTSGERPASFLSQWESLSRAVAGQLLA
jgi:hypothetical protein